MNPYFRNILLCAVLIATNSFSLHAAQLTWDRLEAKIELPPGEDEAKAIFRVTNEGDEPIRLSKVKTSCGCTGSILSKKIINPGESTEVIGTFNKGKREGLQTNKLTVYIDGQDSPVATLKMVVSIPKLIDVKPQIVYWSKGAEQTERSVHIRLDTNYVSRITDINYDATRLELTKTTDKDDSSAYTITLRPKSFDSSLRETIRIHAAGPKDLKTETKIHVFVQP